MFERSLKTRSVKIIGPESARAVAVLFATTQPSRHSPSRSSPPEPGSDAPLSCAAARHIPGLESRSSR